MRQGLLLGISEKAPGFIQIQLSKKVPDMFLNVRNTSFPPCSTLKLHTKFNKKLIRPLVQL